MRTMATLNFPSTVSGMVTASLEAPAAQSEDVEAAGALGDCAETLMAEPVTTIAAAAVIVASLAHLLLVMPGAPPLGPAGSAGRHSSSAAHGTPTVLPRGTSWVGGADGPPGSDSVAAAAAGLRANADATVRRCPSTSAPSTPPRPLP